MRPLYRKDRLWLLALGATGVIVHLGMQFTQDAVWVRPDDQWGGVALAFSWVAATLLGLVAACIDEVTHTREYLLHRSVSHARVFWSRHAACALVLLAWAALVPALHLAITLLVTPDAFLVERGRIVWMIDSGMVAFAFYGLAYFCATLVRRIGWALPLAGLMATALVAVALGRQFGHSRDLTAIPITPFALALAVVLLGGAFASEREGRDADVQWSGRRLARAGLILVLVVAPAASYALHTYQEGMRGELWGRYPFIGRTIESSEGGGQAERFGLFLWGESRRQLIEVDGAQRPVGAAPPGSVRPVFTARTMGRSPARAETFGRVSRGRGFRGRDLRSIGCPRFVYCHAARDGWLHVVRHSPDGLDSAGIPEGGEPGRFRLGPTPGQPFGGDHVTIGEWWNGFGHVGDPATGRLWRVDLYQRSPAFVPIELPEGDRFRADLTSAVRMSLYERPVPGPRPAFAAVLKGERGYWIVGDDGRLVAAPEPLRRLAQDIERDQRMRFVARPTGALTFAVDVYDDRGRMVLQHHYQPPSVPLHALSASIYGASLLRGPIFVWAGRLFPTGRAHSPGVRWFRDPLAAHAGAGLLVANFLIALALTAHMSLRLRRAGASPGRRTFWAASILLGGPAIWLCARLIETDRAWGRLPVPAAAAAPAPRLLIETA